MGEVTAILKANLQPKLRHIVDDIGTALKVEATGMNGFYQREVKGLVEARDQYFRTGEGIYNMTCVPRMS